MHKIYHIFVIAVLHIHLICHKINKNKRTNIVGRIRKHIRGVMSEVFMKCAKLHGTTANRRE